MPSNREQISATAAIVAASPESNAGLTAMARSTNNSTAGDAVPVRASSDGTGHNCSAATRSPSRLVASTCTVGAPARITSTSSALSSSTCSQLSNTTSSRRPAKACATLAAMDVPAGVDTPNALATASGDGAGVDHRRQLDQPHAIGKLARQLGRHLQRQPRFSNSTDAGQCHQPMSPHELDDFLHLARAPDQARGLDRKVPRCRIQRPQR